MLDKISRASTEENHKPVFHRLQEMLEKRRIKKYRLLNVNDAVTKSKKWTTSTACRPFTKRLRLSAATDHLMAGKKSTRYWLW